MNFQLCILDNFILARINRNCGKSWKETFSIFLTVTVAEMGFDTIVG